MKKAVIILPTYNEKENIKTLIPKIFHMAKKITNWQISILVVDDYSPDNTAKIVEKLQEKYPDLFLVKKKKEGLGKAYNFGFSYALKNIKPEVIFEMDADWSHDPRLIPQFLKEIEKGNQFVIGSRYIEKGSIPSDWAWYRKIFSVVGNLICQFGFMNFSVKDWTSGYRAINANFIKKVINKLHSFNGYVFQIALLDNAIKMGLKIKEIPLNFKDRKIGSSKINSFQYIVDVIFYILKNSSFVKFIIVGGIGFIIDFSLSFLLIEKLKLIVFLSTAISAEIAIISNFLLNNFWSFSYKKITGKWNSIFSQFLKFNLVSLGSILIQSFLLQIATIIFPLKYWFFYKAIIIIFLIIPYSYYFYNKIVWTKKPDLHF